MTILMYLSLVLCICLLISNVILTIVALSLRKRVGDFDRNIRFYKRTTQITKASWYSGIAFAIFGFWGKTWSTASGAKILIGLVIILFVIDVFHDFLTPDEYTTFKNEKAKKKYYDGAAEYLKAHRRNEMGFFMNDGPCPVCGKDSIGVEPYRFYCPYCKLTAELTEDDIKQWNASRGCK